VQSGDGGCVLARYDHVENDDLRVLLEDVTVVVGRGVLAVERAGEGETQEKEQSHG
jgi:hypothetical protein